jgi:tetratricopeptide (TPR) repeat protein
MGDLQLGEGAFRGAVALRQDASSLVCLGAVLRERHKLQESEEVIREAISLEPNFSEAWLNLALVLKELGLWDKAKEALVRALAIEPNYPAAVDELRQVEKHLSGLEKKGAREDPNTLPTS